MAPMHPLPYANAARAYHQLQQPSIAEKHLSHALQLDSGLTITWVDLAQVQILTWPLNDPQSSIIWV